MSKKITKTTETARKVKALKAGLEAQGIDVKTLLKTPTKLEKTVNGPIHDANRITLENMLNTLNDVVKNIWDIAGDCETLSQDAYCTSLNRIADHIANVRKNLDKRLEHYAKNSAGRSAKATKLAEKIAKLQAELAKVQ
jgi:hypothetical protein